MPYPSPQQPQFGYPPQPVVYQARFRKHTGMLILAQWTDASVVGSIHEVRAAYRGAQSHCLLAGWWGVFSMLFYNPMALVGNWSEMRRITHLAKANGEVS
ncbi:hypothetical protein SCNU_13859 [Gordonia neofelifaecis NRRL B-59395]|uniref:Uncharacterized protein n=2 Tax=Gordonia TaxID=2053 RepID=F1YLI0_9ACTN|nr:hypothetical protein SCNU_13859 [Gordonia neofelifaecis NRRL B-59395]